MDNDDEIPEGEPKIRKLFSGKQQPDWRLDLVENSDGSIKGTLYNIVKILTAHPEWRDVLRYDAFANRIYKTREPPYGGEAGEFVDVDASEVAIWLGSPYNLSLNVASSMVSEAVLVAASRNAYHPVTEYLDGLEWDGIERLPTMLSDFFGAEQNDYTAVVGASWLVSAVARVRKPGCKVDTMVILEGGQGVGKSTAVRTLCGPVWFAEMLESPQNKDFYQILSGRWIVEIAELQSFSKADRNRIKQAITAQEDTYRPSYGHHASQHSRQCIFVGTTNDESYLQDETGARRFLPVKCTEINLEAIENLRDQFWAEADRRFKRGDSWWKFPACTADEQDARYDSDVWEEPVVAWLNGEMDSVRYPAEIFGAMNQGKPLDVVTTAQIMQYALGIETGKHSQLDKRRVNAVMRHLGWKEGRPRGADDYRPRVWKRPSRRPRK
ncbi:MAG: virulence-associated E family protein [Pseudomonadota bacterium]|nr:virulence-associated E family protein [Pseudomonadota bacterium]